MTNLLAIQPTATATVIHLELPGYQPSNKTRGIDAPLCGTFVQADRKRVPLADALDWPGSKCTCGCAHHWRWCRNCVGHAAELAGITEQVLALVLTAPPRASAGAS